MHRRRFLAAAYSPLACMTMNEMKVNAKDNILQTPMNLDWISVKDKPYNAVGDGVADDTLKIRAAIDAVRAQPMNRGTVYFPPGEYAISGAIDLNPDCNIIASRVGIIPWKNGKGETPYKEDAFIFGPGNYGGLQYWMPSISNFSCGAAIRFGNGTSLALVNIPSINSCKYGLRFGPAEHFDKGGGDIFNHHVRFENINACEYGISLESKSGPKDNIQGLCIEGNLLIACQNGIYFLGNGSNEPYGEFSGNHFFISVFNGNFWKGDSKTKISTNGIVLDNMLCRGGNVFDCPNFGSFPPAGNFIECRRNAAWYNASFRLGVWGDASYEAFNLFNGGVGSNSFKDLMNNGMKAYANAQFGAPNKGQFGVTPGRPIFSNHIVLNLHFDKTVKANTHHDFYAFSPYCMGGHGGGTGVGPRFSIGLGKPDRPPLVVIGCHDESEFSDALTHEKYRIRIRIYALADIPGDDINGPGMGTNVPGLLEVAP